MARASHISDNDCGSKMQRVLGIAGAHARLVRDSFKGWRVRKSVIF